MSDARGGSSRPLLLVDIDGVISLFGVQTGGPAGQPAIAGSEGRPAVDGPALDGSFHSIEGIPHFLSSTAAAHLLSLAPLFELVWASGWEERANEHLPHLLGLPGPLPFLRFPRGVLVAGAGTIPETLVPAVGAAGAPGQAGEPEAGGPPASGPQTTLAHWKLEAVDTYAGERPLAWIDDAFNPACHDWAAARPSATLLVQTDPERGLTQTEARLLAEWARERSQAG
jgi:hypothetical protein